MLAQILALVGLNLRSIRQRLGSSAVAVFGIVGVVIVFIAVLSIAEGLRGLEEAGDPDIALVLRAGSDTEMTSGFYMEHVNAIAEAPGVSHDNGDALASPELLVIINVPLRRNGLEAQVPLRGVLPVAFKVHDRLSIVAGRISARRSGPARTPGTWSASSRTTSRWRRARSGATPGWRSRSTTAATRISR
jgi:putative ABC transport system permease protein